MTTEDGAARRDRVLAGACIECGGEHSAECPHCDGTGREPLLDRWFWLSFADASLPKGSQFLGGCWVRAGSLPMAIAASHALSINPGGEVQASEVPPQAEVEFERRVPLADRHRLLSRAEIEAAR